MSRSDLRPVRNAPGFQLIAPTADNRLGAVLSSLFSFWIARQAAVFRDAQSGGRRRDAYSVIFFSADPKICVENDLTSSPNELLTSCLGYTPNESHNYTRAIQKAQSLMVSHLCTERCGPPVHGILIPSARETDLHHRAPVLIFLTDGQSHIHDTTMYNICVDAANRKLVELLLHSHVTDSINPRMPLSFQAVSFGPEPRSTVLSRMVEIAQEVENNARDPLIKNVPSSFTKALLTVSVKLFHPSEIYLDFIRPI